MLGDHLGYFEKHQFLSKTCEDTFLATFGKNWAAFNSNIWSHCIFLSCFCLFTSDRNRRDSVGPSGTKTTIAQFPKSPKVFYAMAIQTAMDLAK